MSNDFLAKIFEHNNWANAEIIKVCSALTDEQFDAEPQSATWGTIRRTLWHLVHAQAGYLALLTATPRRYGWPAPPPLAELEEAARVTGEGLVRLARGEENPADRLQTRDGFYVEPWVVMLQVINHASEHREQINSMVTALGVAPRELDGWNYGEVTGALVPIPRVP